MSKQILKPTNSRVPKSVVDNYPFSKLILGVSGQLLLASTVTQNLTTLHGWILTLGEKTQKINEHGNLQTTPSGVIPINQGDPIASVGYVNDVTKTLKHNKHFNFIDNNEAGEALQPDERAIQLYSYDFEVPNEGSKVSINYNTVTTTILGTDVLTIEPAVAGSPAGSLYDINAKFNPIKNLGVPIDGGDAVPKDFLTSDNIKTTNSLIPGETLSAELEWIRNNLGQAAVQWHQFASQTLPLEVTPTDSSINSIAFISTLARPVEDYRSLKLTLDIDNTTYTSETLNFSLVPGVKDLVHTQSVNFFSDKFNTSISLGVTLQSASGTDKGKIIISYDISSSTAIPVATFTLWLRLQMGDVAPYASTGPVSPIRFEEITNDTRVIPVLPEGNNGKGVINWLLDKGIDNENKITTNTSSIATNISDIATNTSGVDANKTNIEDLEDEVTELSPKVDSSIPNILSMYQKDKATPDDGGFIHMEDGKTSIGNDNDSIIDINDDGTNKSVDIHGSLKMNSNKITDVGTPTEDTDVTTKEYVDTHSGLLPEELDKRIDYSTPGNTLFYSADKATPNVGSGIYLEPAEIDVVVEDRQVMTITKDNVDVAADMTLNDNKISNVANPTEVQDVSTKGYTDTSITKLETQTKGRYYNNVLHNLIKNDRVHTPTGYLEPSTYAYPTNQTHPTQDSNKR